MESLKDRKSDRAMRESQAKTVIIIKNSTFSHLQVCQCCCKVEKGRRRKDDLGADIGNE